MERMTFKERYDAEKAKPTRAQEFVAQIAAVAHCTESTVRQWLSGVQQPDELAKCVLADHFGCAPGELFPPVEGTAR